jgi:hypothetical protein
VAGELSTSPPFPFESPAILAEIRNVFKDACVTPSLLYSSKWNNNCGKNLLNTFLSFSPNIYTFPYQKWGLNKNLSKLSNAKQLIIKSYLSFFLDYSTNDQTRRAKPNVTYQREYHSIFVSFLWMCDDSHNCLNNFVFSVKVHEPLNHLNLNGATNRQLLILSGDVELNPGPNGKLIFGTYNVSGCKEYNKLKILTAWLFNQAKSDRFVFSLQETHIGSKESSLVRMLWRSGVIISPSINNAR